MSFVRLQPEWAIFAQLTLRATKQCLKAVRNLSMDRAHEYLMAKTGQMQARDREDGY